MAGRTLSPLEETEARIVFADGIRYDQVRVIENARWTNTLPRLQAWLAGHRPPSGDNALTLGHRLYFPRPLHTSADSLAAGEIGDFAWLIHELTHVWQMERIGVRYALQALRLHLRIGQDVYGYGGEAAVTAAIQDGRMPDSFSVEQQAEIARDYYTRRRLGTDTTAWEPLIIALRSR